MPAKMRDVFLLFSDGTACLLRCLITVILSLESRPDNDVLTHHSDQSASCISCPRHFRTSRRKDIVDRISSIAQDGKHEIINQSQEACWRLDIITTHL